MGRGEKGPLAHAVPDGAPCRWVARRRRGDRDRLQNFHGRLDVLTQWPSFWLLPCPPLLRLPGLGSSPTAKGDLWGKSTRNMPGSQVKALGGSVVGN